MNAALQNFLPASDRTDSERKNEFLLMIPRSLLLCQCGSSLRQLEYNMIFLSNSPSSLSAPAPLHSVECVFVLSQKRINEK